MPCGACAALLLATADAAADLRAPGAGGTIVTHTVAAAASLHVAQPSVPGNGRWRRTLVRPEHDGRPAALVPLYASFATLQALDAHSTLAGVRNGRSEANPIMAPVARKPVLLIGAKATAAVTSIALSERLWRRHRTAAIVLMVAVNAAHAAVVAHNYRQLRR